METMNRQQCIEFMRNDMSRFFTKASAASQARQPNYTLEERARIRVRELLRGGEISAQRAKRLLQKITTRFTPYNNEQKLLRG